jgi:hypothetical protein
MSEQNKVEKLFEMLRVAASTDNPAQSIVDSIDKLKEDDPELWKVVDEVRTQMLKSMNTMSVEDKIAVLRDFKKMYGDGEGEVK